jgi:small GTP-binding protein
MSRWRILVVVGLIVVPILAWAGVGTFYLWKEGWGFYAWWPLMACMALGYLLGWYWQRKRQLLLPPDFEVPVHWTSRDQEAWKLVEKRAKEAASVPPDKLSEPSYYLDTARTMAQELAEFYHPGAADPVGNLTVPEILSVIELASHDLCELVERHLPGGHLLTINDWKRARQLTQWYNTASNVYWIISAFINPIQTGMRYAASRVGISEPWRMLQQNLFVWFFTAYVHRLGTYLIDLNSGRLRVGAARYRQLLEESSRATGRDVAVAEKQAVGPFPGEGVDPIDQVQQVTIALVGQVKAGKSSLINALLGDERARTAVVPMTTQIDRYELLTPGIPTKLVLLDTAGYHQTGATADQVKATAEAASGADLVFLVLHARNPARQADVDLLDQLRRHFETHTDLKSPPILAVLTHIDLLSPALEWGPPYNWRQPRRPKEQNIHDAVATVRQQLGPRLVNVVPVCTQPGKVYGIDEELLPAVAQLLEEVRGVALLRCLRAEADRDRVRRIFRQLAATGKAAAQLAWEAIKPTA